MIRKVLRDKHTRKRCHIYTMLYTHAYGRHCSFHTPGHKIGRWDVTELSYSDNLSSPNGCIAEAERDIADILGANRSFILTDGSTSGVLATLYAAKRLGVRKIAVCEDSHKSVFHGCALTGITALTYSKKIRNGLPAAYLGEEWTERYGAILKDADCIFLTSPDYYGNIADLPYFRRLCDERGKLLLVDGAHGGHLHFDRAAYAGAYADLWVDGVHKSLPAFTQGAVVSARTQELAERLRESVDVFRTTSPSYPIMASVEYAVKYPRNVALEEAVRAAVARNERLHCGDDWTKLCALFGEYAFEAEKQLENDGIYSEFCDGNVVMFYLSPMTERRQLENLLKKLNVLFCRYPYKKSAYHVCDEYKNEQKTQGRVCGEISCTVDDPERNVSQETERRRPEDAEGGICAEECGLFPPCTPLIRVGERVTKAHIELLTKANNVYGLSDGKILLQKTKNEERGHEER